MATMKNLQQALIERDIDPEMWQQAMDGDGDFVDFMLASNVARALGHGSSAGWTQAEFDEALSVAVERWPAPLSA